MRNLFCCILAESDVAAHMEVYLQNLDVTPPDNDPNSQRMDIYCVIGGQGSLLDFTITHTCLPDASPIRFHRDVNWRNAQLSGGKAPALADKARTNTFSRWAQAILPFLKTLAKRRPRPSAIPAPEDVIFRESVINHWSHLLSVELMKYNALQVANRFQRAVAARGPARASTFAEHFISRCPYSCMDRDFCVYLLCMVASL
ncbi:unnamed protein product [Vitrella brassicaformis CCMP3155]|uniref:Uncharacterized protein n=1 Tax=Vitrella brassicaformis (strain CCMP3155) TaxID=1169540 RepID=A0A0G4GT14_VITBC|nr:unnamed protein product [Vitrella brassicaformis CCMP3155]|eukprot:CEM33834.1 unnamed protein product [Vitrella brassicaformis CCMP3155]